MRDKSDVFQPTVSARRTDPGSMPAYMYASARSRPGWRALQMKPKVFLKLAWVRAWLPGRGAPQSRS
jgi:hypothetical protein